MLRYWHGPPARLHLVVQGRGPSCRVVGRIPTIGRPGLNSVTLPRRVVGPGTYLVSARATPTGTDLARVLLTIRPAGEPHRRVTPPRCGDAPPAGVREVALEVAGAPAPAKRQRVPSRDPSGDDAPETSGVLGVIVPPEPPSPADEASSLPAALAAALGVAALLAVGTFFVIRRGRRPRPVEVLPSGYRPSGGWVEPAFDNVGGAEAQATAFVEGRATVVERAARPARERSRRR